MNTWPSTKARSQFHSAKATKSPPSSCRPGDALRAVSLIGLAICGNSAAARLYVGTPTNLQRRIGISGFLLAHDYAAVSGARFKYIPHERAIAIAGLGAPAHFLTTI